MSTTATVPSTGPVSARDPRRLGWALVAAALVLDQATKAAMLPLLTEPPRLIEIAGFFNLVPVWNRGVSFGLLSSGPEFTRWALTAFALGVSVALGVWLTRATRPWLAPGLGLILGGAVGNAVDRIRFGAVFDFIDLHGFGYHWPAFNVADSAITVGVVLLLIDSFAGGSAAAPAREDQP